MTVHLQTSGYPAGAGTNSTLYLGLVGRAGGREFAISGSEEDGPIHNRYGLRILPELRAGIPMKFSGRAHSRRRPVSVG